MYNANENTSVFGEILVFKTQKGATSTVAADEILVVLVVTIDSLANKMWILLIADIEQKRFI